MTTAAEPVLRATFQSGVDLEKVRQTKVFYIDRNPKDIGAIDAIETFVEYEVLIVGLDECAQTTQLWIYEISVLDANEHDIGVVFNHRVICPRMHKLIFLVVDNHCATH